MAGTVRVRDETHRLLEQLSNRQHRPMSDVVADAVEHYRREEVLAAADRGYAEWRQRGGTEDELWDTTLRDGLPEA